MNNSGKNSADAVSLDITFRRRAQRTFIVQVFLTWTLKALARMRKNIGSMLICVGRIKKGTFMKG